jgi:sugar phosphate permease
MKLTSSWFDEQGFGGAWSVLTTSSRVGAIVGGLTAGAVMRQRWGSWRAILRISGALQLLMAGVMALLLRSGPVTRAQRPKSADSGGGGGGGYLVALRALLTHRRVALTFMAQACVLPLLELNSLLPLYLVQTAGVRSATASTLATSYPLGGIIGMLFTVRGCWYGCG